MEKYYFQVNPDENRKRWEDVKPMVIQLPDRAAASQIAKDLANQNNAEVRWSDDSNWRFSNGTYTNHG